jgi:arginine-tRNA-protein transferase
VTSSSEHVERTERLAGLLAQQPLEPGEPYACPYLPGRLARQISLGLPRRQPGLYHALMDLNFRRLGAIVYRPSCPGCQACRTLRVLADEFRPDRAQRRCARRNADLRVEMIVPHATREKHALYARYLRARHDGQMTGEWAEFLGFLYASQVQTREVLYWAGERLVAACVVDVEPEALSAVYCYFEPSEVARGPGVFNVLWLVEECRRRHLPYLYLGYHVAGSPAMDYKARYRPHETLEPDGRWRRG